MNRIHIQHGPDRDVGVFAFRRPRDGTDEMSGDESGRRSRDGTEGQPRDGTERRPRDGTEQHARDGTIHRSRDGTGKRSRDGTFRKPRDKSLIWTAGEITQYYQGFSNHPAEVQTLRIPFSKRRKSCRGRPAEMTGMGEVRPDVTKKNQ
jgi:hypothetical protein